MGRELRRVPLDFDWPINETWEGFLNPHYTATPCPICVDNSGHSTGYSPYAQKVMDQWYGHRGGIKEVPAYSQPHLPTDDHVVAYAQRQLNHSPGYYGRGPEALAREALRLSNLWNGSLCHHIDQDDVQALINAGRLNDFTHVWRDGPEGRRWYPKEPAVVPTAREVNIWSCSSMGHDSINMSIVIRSRCERAGQPTTCTHCGGHGDIWASKEDEARYNAWKPTPPPEGEGWQIWETVSEGSPITPVFRTPEELARYKARHPYGTDKASYESWMKFLLGDGWAPSAIGFAGGGIMNGVEGLARLKAQTSDDYDPDEYADIGVEERF
ncbi:hypothetical protein CcrColossus_gp307 [Caulobacter phage CcrColossus]|uniref:Uncharacterized protein n=1 Tax=Caulobacter phage CcrColossus TaxID=1211640 RepID=K4K6I9_9CAUD|nr:hypothetical protein CcrColossus_gp307 [Caulobacter phage CcrColossus]AFU88177.1 hypothetical protein CcrColossus_gp307 [Caulobacter phage CcrColossus]